MRCSMFGWAITFLIIALIAAVLGFGGIAGFAIEAAKIVFFVALILFVLSAVFGVLSGRRSKMPLGVAPRARSHFFESPFCSTFLGAFLGAARRHTGCAYP